ncbi:MAG: SPOR domain-containing protein [Prevotella sp.]|nr:SPOR domain-containing protein [Prevotella sp.]
MEKLYRSRNSLRKCVLFFIFYFLFSPVGAQSFTQRIQQQKAGQGTITIHESAEIDQLVNDAKLGNVAAPTNTTKPATTKPATTKPANTTTNTAANNTSTANNQTAQDETTEETVVEPTKKIMTGGYKINGYRVQAFAGGNSRKDRQQAEHVGNQIKGSYPGVPVYVHFYSPRWICRVGNYRTYEEAHQMLLSLRKMGFTEAVVVKGKITVYD